MSLRTLPEISAAGLASSPQFELRPDALERWQPGIQAASEDDATINIYEVIGKDWEGRGATAQKTAAILRSVGERDVIVNINSPGGDVFEGIAIYNILRQHRAKVTTRVMGLAASVASLIAMAGDEIEMGDGASIMVHNAWAVAVGNRHDMQAAHDVLEPIDMALADLYVARTGKDKKTVVKMMDAETWMGVEDAIASGFATAKIDRALIKETSGGEAKRALAMVEMSMAKAGYSRSARRDAFQQLFTGTPRAAEPATPRASDFMNELEKLTLTLKEK